MARKKAKLPPMERRPVFVQYVSMRRCWFNPSYARFAHLPRVIQLDISERYEKRHRGTSVIDLELSEPPRERKKGR